MTTYIVCTCRWSIRYLCMHRKDPFFTCAGYVSYRTVSYVCVYQCMYVQYTGSGAGVASTLDRYIALLYSTRYATLTTHTVGRDRQSCMSRSAHTRTGNPGFLRGDGQAPSRPLRPRASTISSCVRAYVEQEAVRLDR